jgi:hypothetical protein
LVVPGDAKGLATMDANGDGRPDFVVAMNNDAAVVMEHQEATGRLIAVRLIGRSGNPTGVGARVHLTLADGSVQTAEVAAGSGYLSQSTAALSFGLGSSGGVRSIDVRWPDGTTTRLDNPTVQKQYTIRQSDVPFVRR